MKKLNRLLIFILSFCIVLSMTGCDSLEITEPMQQAIDKYIAAVSKSESKESGKVTVTTLIDDDAIEFKKTESVIEFEYLTVDEKVTFNRTDYIDSVESTKYRSDGVTVEKLEADSEEWVDCTAENENFLSPDSNPLTTLSLFRIDSKLNVKTEYLTDIKSYEQDGQTVVEFTLKDSTVSDVLSYYKAKGIVRESAGHTRAYFIDENGFISKIVITTSQKIISNGEEGTYTNSITVICE